MNYIGKSFLLIGIAVIAIAKIGISQTDRGVHERAMMGNRTNVLSEGQDYTLGIINDTSVQRGSLIRYVKPEEYGDDASVSSEDDILIQSFTGTSIHRPKSNFAELSDTIVLQLVNESSQRYFSFPCEYSRVTSNFGPRRRRYHYGIDLGLKTGEPIKAMFDGRVRVARYAGAYGNLVVVEHYNQLETYYAHLSKLDVEEGQMVKAGELLGLGGSTGRSTGPHLHLEIRYEGAAINPKDILDFTNNTLVCDSLELTKYNFRHQSVRSSNQGLANNSSGASYITVRRGDNLSTIARRNGTTVARLRQLNNLRGTRIIAGQRLRIR